MKLYFGVNRFDYISIFTYMIKTSHNNLARFLFSAYLQRLMKKNFSGFLLVNLPSVHTAGGSVLLAPNHFSWWDGFFIDILVKEVYPGYKLYLMMLEDQLKRFWFFRFVGAFSINPGNVRSSLESLRYAAGMLNEANNAVVIYPQGEIQPYDTDTYILKEGLAAVLKNSPVSSVQPVAFKIQYENEKLPVLYCRFGNKVSSSASGELIPALTGEFILNRKLLNEAAARKESVRRIF